MADYRRWVHIMRAWMSRRREPAPPPPAPDEEVAWEEVTQVTDEAEVARMRFMRSFAELEAEIWRRRRPRA